MRAANSGKIAGGSGAVGQVSIPVQSEPRFTRQGWDRIPRAREASGGVQPVLRGSRRAFTLMEMLVVITVIGVLFAFSAPQLFSLIQASSITSAGSLLRNKLSQAQQIALSKNVDVEVRFFKFSDESAAALDEEIRGFQFFQYDDEGVEQPVSQFFRMQAPVVISTNSKLSTLLQAGSGGNSPMKGKYEIPRSSGMGKESADYVSFRFRPDGSTDLPGKSPGNDTWHITLVKEGSDTGRAPDNFYTVQVDSYNGKITEYRP